MKGYTWHESTFHMSHTVVITQFTNCFRVLWSRAYSSYCRSYAAGTVHEQTKPLRFHKDGTLVVKIFTSWNLLKPWRIILKYNINVCTDKQIVSVCFSAATAGRACSLSFHKDDTLVVQIFTSWNLLKPWHIM